MFLQRLQFILYFLLLIFVPKCYAPPIQEEYTQLTSKLPIVSILKTVLLGYMTHVVTVRPRNGVTEVGTTERRLFAFMYPCSGIGLAVGSMYKALFEDRILGISQYNSLLKGYDKEKEKEEGERKKENEKEMEENEKEEEEKEEEKDQGNGSKNLTSYELHSQAIHLRNRLIDDKKAENINIGEDDNSAYLAAFLHVLGPEKAKKTKHCILNGSLIIGFENEDKTMDEDSYCLSDEITINGPGANCRYQRAIEPCDVRYLSTDMIYNLRAAHNTDETSYVEIFVTIGQLFFTTIECMDIDGDRWSKVIMIIYTAMSVLQSTSLFILHKQTMSFSIKDDEELLSKDEKYILTEDDRKLLGEFIDILGYDDEEIAGISMILGVIASLLIAIWADYNAHSITEWLVLSWILSPIFAAMFFILIGYLDCDGNSRWLVVSSYVLFSTSTGLILSATIIGYLPK
ncbi:hypothetical protein CLU79DRAFT_739667 [Phycomyces nitens]|nr:hypothetical protein CLU79DRAFT_739667 [Phycomyces nitens]